MYEFMVIVAAILVAQVLFMIGTLTVMCNPKFLKWYSKKIMKTTMELTAELEEEFLKEDGD